jgi:hypothetical protein
VATNICRALRIGGFCPPAERPAPPRHAAALTTGVKVEGAAAVGDAIAGARGDAVGAGSHRLAVS